MELATHVLQLDDYLFRVHSSGVRG
jgi:hypothetical protein